jgi:hypothetical protein
MRGAEPSRDEIPCRDDAKRGPLSLRVRTISKKASRGIPDHYDIIIAALKILKPQEAER